MSAKTARRRSSRTTAIAAPYTFTGTIAKVTIDLKEMTPADKAAADKAAAEAEVKKALWK